MTIDQAALDTFVGRFVTDLAAAAHAATVVVGDKLGLYQALAEHGPATAGRAGRGAPAATSGYLARVAVAPRPPASYAHYDPATGRFHLDEVQAACLADSTNPAFLAGGDDRGVVDAQGRGVGPDAFRTGAGAGVARAPAPTCSTAPSGSSGPATSPTSPAPGSRPSTASRHACRPAPAWPTSAAGTARRRSCSREAYPASTIVGFDYHEPSIDVARKRAAERGLADRVRFEVAGGRRLPRHRLRPRVHLRRPPRHGRSGGRRAAHPPGAGRGRHLAARRAARRRAPRGQPQPRGPDLLLGLHHDLHAGVAERRSVRASARRPATTGCRGWSPPAGSPGSVGPPRRRSTRCSRCGP